MRIGGTRMTHKNQKDARDHRLVPAGRSDTDAREIL